MLSFNPLTIIKFPQKAFYFPLSFSFFFSFSPSSTVMSCPLDASHHTDGPLGVICSSSLRGAGVAGLTSACTLHCLPAFLFDQLAVADWLPVAELCFERQGSQVNLGFLSSSPDWFLARSLSTRSAFLQEAPRKTSDGNNSCRCPLHAVPLQDELVSCFLCSASCPPGGHAASHIWFSQCSRWDRTRKKKKPAYERNGIYFSESRGRSSVRDESAAPARWVTVSPMWLGFFCDIELNKGKCKYN